MGKAQSKRSVDITTETKKGTEDEIPEKMEKIEDMDKKDINGDATTSEESVEQKDTTNEVANDKDTTTEKDPGVRASGDAAETQNASVAPKGEGESVMTEEISPLADENIKKSKKEKVKKKWSFRSISFGKKDKQKPAKSEDAAEDGSATTNLADSDEKRENSEDDARNDESAIENADKTKENLENGNSTPPKLNGGDQNEDRKSLNEKSNNITANIISNTTTETCAPVQNETATVSSELSERTESTGVKNETKITENVTVDDMSKNGNGIDEKMTATDQEQQKAGIINIPVDTPSDKTSTLTSVVTNDTSVTTNGDVDQIHQNGGHAESEQKFIEKSKGKIEVNSNTDKVSDATLDSISSTSINPSNVQIHAQDLNASSEKPDEVIQIITEESVIQKFIVTETNSCIVDQSSLCEIDSMIDVENKVQVEVVPDLTSETTDNAKSSEDKFGIDSSPPPLPISPPPSQVSVFAFKSNDESIDDSNKIKNFQPTATIINLHEEGKNNELPPELSEFPMTETIGMQNTTTNTLNVNIDECTSTFLNEHVLEINVNKDFIGSVDIQCREENMEEMQQDGISICKNNEGAPVSLFEKEEIKSQEYSVAVAAEVINEITETAVQIVNQQLNNNKKKQGLIKVNSVAESNDNKTQNDKQEHHGEQKYVPEISYNSSESVPVIEQTNNLTFDCSLDFATPDSIQQSLGEMNSLNKTEDILGEKYLDHPIKEFAIAKDITVAEITQDLSVTCE